MTSNDGDFISRRSPNEVKLELCRKKCNQPEDAGSDEDETQVDLNKPERGHEPVQEAPQTCPCECHFEVDANHPKTAALLIRSFINVTLTKVFEQNKCMGIVSLSDRWEPGVVLVKM